MPLTEELIRESLKQVIDPELFVNIIDLGLVYNVTTAPATSIAQPATVDAPHGTAAIDAHHQPAIVPHVHSADCNHHGHTAHTTGQAGDIAATSNLSSVTNTATTTSIPATPPAQPAVLDLASAVAAGQGTADAPLTGTCGGESLSTSGDCCASADGNNATPHIQPEFEDIFIEMTLTSPACPAGPQLIANTKQVLGRLEGVNKVEVRLVMIPPWTPDKMTEAARDQLGIF
ncbi:MAG: iron-sulfur cluster assembly protein [Pirellulales bacterium]|nr:iron-sulfur cluster assembly protein [Pirellulales bacterium]